MNSTRTFSPSVKVTKHANSAVFDVSSSDSGDETDAERATPTSGASNETGKRNGPLKFFLVEDNPIIRENLAETLHEMVGAEIVGTSETQSEATSWLCDPSHEWDVAVVDIFLKRGNGIQVVAALKASKPQQRVVVLSNYASAEVRRECLRLGADAVFDKSTELDDLIDFCINVRLH